jgi:hypothetical protein
MSTGTPSCIPVDMIKVKDAVPKVTLSSVSPVDSLPANLVPDGLKMELPLRVDEQPESGLNLCLGRGRFDRIKGTYQPRHWNEVEISSDKLTRDNPLYPKTPNTKPQKVHAHQQVVNQCEFRSYLFDGQCYRPCKLQTYAAFNKAMGSSPRTVLGEFIKGQLEKAGVLRAPDAITSETLRAYGRDTVTLIRYTDMNVKETQGLRNKVYVLDFSVSAQKAVASVKNPA